MAIANDTYLIECGTVEPQADAAAKYRKVIPLDTHPIEGNINLKYQNIGMRLALDIPSIGWDILEVAANVYRTVPSCVGLPSWQTPLVTDTAPTGRGLW